MVMTTMFQNSDVQAAVRRYLLTRGERLELEAGVIEGMSYRDMLHVIAEKGTAEDCRTLLKLVIPREDSRKTYYDAKGKPHDMDDDRRANIKTVDEALALYPGVKVAPGVPAGPPFREFEVDGLTLTDAYRRTKEWIHLEGPAMLVLGGPPGVGKTHLCVAAANELLESGQTVIYRREPDLLGELQSHVPLGTLETHVKEFEGVPWLIIDDLGVKAGTDWANSIKDRLFDSRWAQAEGGQVRTMIATNLFADDLPPRQASRLKDRQRSRVVNIKAKDYRERER